MAGTTGLEPATSAVTGQRSNQLSYVPNFFSSTFTKSKNIVYSAAVYLFSCVQVLYGIKRNSESNKQNQQQQTLPSVPLQAIRNPEHLSMSLESNCTKQICSSDNLHPGSCGKPGPEASTRIGVNIGPRSSQKSPMPTRWPDCHSTCP